MNRLKIIFSFIVIFTLVASAQPAHDWVVNYGDGVNDYFYDIYLASNGGYAMCGRDGIGRFGRTSRPWIVLTNGGGVEIANNSYNILGENGLLYTIIESENGGFLAGGSLENPPKFWVLRVDEEGEVIFFRDFGGAGGEGYCKAVIELKDGTYVAVGRNRNQGYMVNFNDDGEMNWEEYYRSAGVGLPIYSFNSMRETDEGILLAGSANNDRAAILVSVDNEGEVLWSRPYVPPNGDGQSANFNSLISYRDGFAMVGENVWRQGGSWYSWYWFLHVERNGDVIWNKNYEIGEVRGDQKKILYSVVEEPDGGLVAVGNGQDEEEDGIIIRVDKHGDIKWYQHFPFVAIGSKGFYAKKLFSTLIHSDGGIITVGQGRRNIDDQLMDSGGLLLKIDPEKSAPDIDSFRPAKIVVDVLIDDSVQFAVEASDIQGDSLRYLWTVDEEEVSRLDSTLVHFDEIRNWNVVCAVSDRVQTSTVDWQVHVAEWYIESYSPDSLSWVVRRPREIDFSIRTQAIEGVEPIYRWIMTDREGRRVDIGNEPDITYEFDLRGDYTLEGRVFHEQITRFVRWRILVRSVVHWWRPFAREFEAELDSEIEFSVLPFNPDSDSLEYRWLVDGEEEDDEVDYLNYSFDSYGVYTVEAIVHDGAEVDTVEWTVTLNDPNTVPRDRESLVPTEVTLYPAAPNPFNSTTSIRYFLPNSANVRLTVYNSVGRLVQTLNDEHVQAGHNRATLHGTDLPAGVYLLRLEAGNTMQTLKVVLLK